MIGIYITEWEAQKEKANAGFFGKIFINLGEGMQLGVLDAAFIANALGGSQGISKILALIK
jgi:hypothetical protein